MGAGIAASPHCAELSERLSLAAIHSHSGVGAFHPLAEASGSFTGSFLGCRAAYARALARLHRFRHLPAASTQPFSEENPELSQ
jgi:hypothetical protein